MSKVTKILFPTEFGPLGEKAEANAVNLAKLYDAELVLMHAIHIPGGLSKLFSQVNEDDLRKKAVAELEAYGKQLDPSGELDKTTLVRVEDPEVAIVKAAQETAAGIIIFGTKGGSGLRDTMLGSAVNAVIRHAPCPVLTIRNKPEYAGFKRILVPIDLAQEAVEKVDWGIKLAKLFGAELHLYSVVTGSADDLLKLESRIKKSIDYARSQGIESVDAKLDSSTEGIADATLAYADKIDADLICIMTQQESETGLKTTLLGSVADRLVNISQRAVISIRPERHYKSLDRRTESPLFT